MTVSQLAAHNGGVSACTAFGELSTAQGVAQGVALGEAKWARSTIYETRRQAQHTACDDATREWSRENQIQTI